MSSEYAFLYVEDDENMIEAMDTSIYWMKRSEEYIFNMKVVNSSDEAIRALDNDVFDFVLIDIKLSGEDSGDTVIEKIKKDYKIPCAILSGTPDVTDNDLIKVYKKSEISNEDVLKQMASEVDSGLFKVIGERGLLEENLKDLFWNNFYKNIDYWKDIKASLEDEKMNQLILRYTISHLYELLDSESEQYEAIEMFINPNITLDGVKTGTILLDLDSETFYIVLSPPCDLALREDDKPKNEFIILVEIENYNEYISTESKSISNSFKKDIEKLVKNNHSNNLYWLSNYFDIFDGGFVNFRKIKTESFDALSNDAKYKKIIKLQDNFVKSLLSKFSMYYNRQGQPDFDFPKVALNIAEKIVNSK